MVLIQCSVTTVNRSVGQSLMNRLPWKYNELNHSDVTARSPISFCFKTRHYKRRILTSHCSQHNNIVFIHSDVSPDVTVSSLVRGCIAVFMNR